MSVKSSIMGSPFNSYSDAHKALGGGAKKTQAVILVIDILIPIDYINLNIFLHLTNLWQVRLRR